MKLAIRMHPDDNVATAIEPLAAGEPLAVLSERGDEVDRLAALTAVPLAFHKVALRLIAVGETVRKYGEIIGHATAPIARGEWIHTHNIESAAHPGTAGGGEEA
ncbi:MAG: UxaA family hydrolase [Chloroflexota bacterium]